MANKNYLDDTGLAYLWQKVKDWVSARLTGTYVVTDPTTAFNATDSAYDISLRRTIPLVDGLAVLIRLKTITVAQMASNSGYAVRIKTTSWTKPLYHGISGVYKVGDLPVSANGAANMLVMYNASDDRFYAYDTVPGMIGFGVGNCSTAADVTEKEVAVANWSPKANGLIVVTFTYGAVSGNKLNVNGHGAKTMSFNGATIGADDVVMLYWNGTSFTVVGKLIKQ